MCVIFSNNQLKDLPDELASLHLLREIAISYNRYDPAAVFCIATYLVLRTVEQPGLHPGRSKWPPKMTQQHMFGCSVQLYFAVVL